MVSLKLNRLILVFLLFALIAPIGMETAFAQKTGNADISQETDTTTVSRGGLERSAVSGKDTKTFDFPDVLQSELSKSEFDSMAPIEMERTSLHSLGKSLNNPVNSLEGLTTGFATSGSRAEPADNSPTGAIEMTDGMAARQDSVGSGTDTQDWYKIALTNTLNLHEQVVITIHNNVSSPGNLTAVLFDTNELLGQIGYPLVSKQYRTNPSSINAGGIPANTTDTLTARAPETGDYFMGIAPSSGVCSYTILSVAVSTAAPMDYNNDWTTASKETNTQFLGTLIQNTDHWNWHNVSSHFANTGADYDNNLSYTMTITAENYGDIAELASIGNFRWVSWSMVTILFNDDGGNWFLYHHEYYYGASSVAEIGNTRYNPERGWVIVNGTYAYIGVEVKSIFLWTDGNSIYMDDWYTIGNSQYSMQLVVDELDLNYQPQLNYGKVTPKYGYDTDNFTFEVTWTDGNNEPPQKIELTLDETVDKKVFDMEMKVGESPYYDAGVIYEITMQGDVIGDQPYPHEFKFSADDGRKNAIGDTKIHKDQLYIVSNLPPEIHPDKVEKVIMNEDDGDLLVDLYDIFLDPDGATDWTNGRDNDGHTLDFSIRNDADTAWISSFQNEFVTVTIMDIDSSTKLKITPLEDESGKVTVKLNATDESLYVDDKYEHYIETTFDIEVNPVNDGPIMKSVPDFTKASAGSLIEDAEWTYTFNATDVDNEVLIYSTNIEDVFLIDDEKVLKTDPNTYDYELDPLEGTIKFTPTNDFIGTYTINVTVTDNHDTNPKTDYDEFVLEILNTNDPPKITEVGRKDVIPGTTLAYEVKQNEKLELEITAIDPDIEIGERDSLKYYMDIEERSNLLLDEIDGILTFIPNQNDVSNRTTMITLTVRDTAFAEDSVDIRIRVTNVNDPPRIDEIEQIIVDADINTQQLENLTVQFKVLNPFDPDGDAISFSWDFNSAVNLDHLGASDDDSELQGLDNIFHTYPNQGEYFGMLIVKDAIGATVKYNFTVNVKAPPLTKPDVEDKGDSGEEPSVFNMGTYGGVDAAYWITIMVVIIIITFLMVMFMIRKKRSEIEKLRHTERFRHEEMDDEGRVEAPADLEGRAGQKQFDDAPVARSAAELYSSDTGAVPSIFDAPQQGMPPSGQYMGQPGMPPLGMGPGPQQPLSLPPPSQIQPMSTPTPPQGDVDASQMSGGPTNMKCTSCGTPINPEWFICPGCHRFLK